jgi:ABC-type branched-subunit amino acid transport system ATPase component
MLGAGATAVSPEWSGKGSRTASNTRVDQLQARGIRVHFEGVKGDILGLIGPNGAGKTTLVNALSGFVRPTSGVVSLADVDITSWSPQRLARSGVGRTFQDVRLFRGLTVLENTELGALAAGARRKEARELAWEILYRLRLTAEAGILAGSLPHGAERRLGIARALAGGPRFLLLDEPATGMYEAETDELVDTLLSIRADYSCGLLLIEHDMRVVMNLCERVQVLDYGKTIALGTPTEVRGDPAVLEAYLGRDEG